ncbi:MAG: SRPBCC family protein, partial [Ilumatobacteraceae bacterium]
PGVAPVSIVHTLFPSVVILETPVSSQMFRIYPGRTVGECTVELTEASLKPTESDEERAARKAGADFAALVVGKEDFPAAEQCQRGAEMGVKSFRFGTNEPMLQHWHRTWQSVLDAA